MKLPTTIMLLLFGVAILTATERSRNGLKALFETGDLIKEESMVDLIESCYNITDDTVMQSTEINTFAKLDTLVADEDLVNLGDAQTFTGNLTFSGTHTVDGAATFTGGLGIQSGDTLTTDLIAESTSDTGVTVEGVRLKDSIAEVDTINEKTADAGVTIEGVLIKDSQVIIPAASSAVADVYVSSAAASDTFNTGVFTSLLTNATLADGGSTTSDFEIGTTTGRVTYKGTETQDFLVQVAFSMVGSEVTETYRLKIGKNGTPKDSTEIERYLGTSADSQPGAAACVGTFSLQTDDYIELFGTADLASDDTITIKKAQIIITQL